MNQEIDQYLFKVGILEEIINIQMLHYKENDMRSALSQVKWEEDKNKQVQSAVESIL